jgi:hypothetical protein
MEQYSLLDPELCGNMEKVHTIKRELYGEIVLTRTEHLVQVTKYTAFQTIESTFCGIHSCARLKRHEKFHKLIVIEPAD